MINASVGFNLINESLASQFSFYQTDPGSGSAAMLCKNHTHQGEMESHQSVSVVHANLLPSICILITVSAEKQRVSGKRLCSLGVIFLQTPPAGRFFHYRQ